MAVTTVGKIVGNALSEEETIALNGPHPRYHFHGFAGEIVSGDSKFFDRSGMGNHAVRGADLSEANMLANAGYVSTLNPSVGAADSVLRIPNLNFDYVGGEKFILYWLGKITPEGATAEWLGDGYNTSNRGINLRATASGMLMFVLYGNTLAYTSESSVAPFDGTLHSFAIAINGAAKTYSMWVDETLNRDSFSLGATAYDTRNSATFNIGSVIASSTEAYGAATQTRSLHILRLSPTDAMPSNATLTNVFKQLRVNPSKPILGSAF